VRTGRQASTPPQTAGRRGESPFVAVSPRRLGPARLAGSAETPSAADSHLAGELLWRTAGHVGIVPPHYGTAGRGLSEQFAPRAGPSPGSFRRTLTTTRSDRACQSASAPARRGAGRLASQTSSDRTGEAHANSVLADYGDRGGGGPVHRGRGRLRQPPPHLAAGAVRARPRLRVLRRPCQRPCGDGRREAAGPDAPRGRGSQR
jgi:hypothetical protein